MGGRCYAICCPGTPNLFWCAAEQPWRDVPVMASAARAQPNSLVYGSIGVGGTGHFGGQTLCQALGISLTHVSYRGTTPLMQDVTGGRVPLLAHDMAGGGALAGRADSPAGGAGTEARGGTAGGADHDGVELAGAKLRGGMTPPGTLPALVVRTPRDLEAVAAAGDTWGKLATHAAVLDFLTRIRTEAATQRGIARSLGSGWSNGPEVE